MDIDEVAVEADVLIDFGAAQGAGDAVADGDEVHIGAVAAYFSRWDGGFAGGPEVEAAGLADADRFEDVVLSHGAPAEGEVDGGYGGEAVEAVGLAAEDAGFDLELGLGHEAVVAYGEGCGVEGVLEWGVVDGEFGVKVAGGLEGVGELAGEFGGGCGGEPEEPTEVAEEGDED